MFYIPHNFKAMNACLLTQEQNVSHRQSHDPFSWSSSSLDGQTFVREVPLLQDVSSREGVLKTCGLLLSCENLVMMRKNLNY